MSLHLAFPIWAIHSNANCSNWLPRTTSKPQTLPDTCSITIEMPFSGKRIGRYRLGRLLGEGTFGRVFLCFDEELQRQVAIKVPTPERFKQAKDAEDYLAEARKVASLDHPHIVPVYDVGRTDDGSVYVVSKFIEGMSLESLIKQDRPSPAAAATLLASCAQALHHAHQKRLIHRDIKPANILIEASTATPYVADFGLAISEEDYLTDGKQAGTPAYMSPEQVRGEGHRLDGRSDIFSAGVVLYELLTGQRPFRGSTTNELYHQVISVDPCRPENSTARFPSSWSGFVSKRSPSVPRTATPRRRNWPTISRTGSRDRSSRHRNSRSFPRGCGRSTPTMPIFFSICCPAPVIAPACRRAFSFGNPKSKRPILTGPSVSGYSMVPQAAGSHRWSKRVCCPDCPKG